MKGKPVANTSNEGLFGFLGFGVSVVLFRTVFGGCIATRCNYACTSSYSPDPTSCCVVFLSSAIPGGEFPPVFNSDSSSKLLALCEGDVLDPPGDHVESGDRLILRDL